MKRALSPDLPLYLCMGHGQEDVSIFCTPAERALKKHSQPPCRSVCPASTYVVLFAEMGSVTWGKTETALIQLFQDRTKGAELQSVVHGGMGEHGMLRNLRLYKPGDELPLLNFNPLNYDKEENTISQSGMYSFPIEQRIRTCEVISLDSDSTKTIIRTVFDGSIAPTVKTALDSRNRRGHIASWQQLGYQLAIDLELLLERQGAGIYFLPICRACKNQYEATAGDLQRVMKILRTPDNEKEVPKYLRALASFTTTNEDFMEEAADLTRITPASHPRLRPFTGAEEEIHKIIGLQRQNSTLQQQRSFRKHAPSAAAGDSAASSPAGKKRKTKIVDLLSSDEDAPKVWEVHDSSDENAAEVWEVHDSSDEDTKEEKKLGGWRQQPKSRLRNSRSPKSRLRKSRSPKSRLRKSRSKTRQRKLRK